MERIDANNNNTHPVFLTIRKIEKQIDIIFTGWSIPFYENIPTEEAAALLLQLVKEWRAIVSEYPAATRNKNPFSKLASEPHAAVVRAITACGAPGAEDIGHEYIKALFLKATGAVE